jgi:hypothetical protein
MTLLLENPLPIWTAGIVLTVICLFVVLAQRSLGSLLALAGVIGLTLLFLLTERFVVTEGEEVEQAIAQLVAALKANDVNGVLALIGPGAGNVRQDANQIMGQLDIRDTGSSSLRVEVDYSTTPHRAISYLRAKIDALHKGHGVRLFYFDQVEINWERSGDNWVIADYRANYRGKWVKAAESVRTNQAVY